MKKIVAAKLLLLLFAATIQVAAKSPVVGECEVGTKAPAYGFWTWAPNASVSVFIVTADFKPGEMSYLLEPIKNWNAVSEATGSGVKFIYLGATAMPLSCENCLTIMRGSVFDKAKRHATELRAYSAHRDQIMTYATIVIDPVLTNPRALTNAVVHELGHNFGLLDCYTCKQKSTVMNRFKIVNVPNEMEAPTACDIAQVRAAYKELAVRVRPSPMARGSEQDEGEEPIDDDTPVVIPRP
jgi:hypothetical protein